MMLTEADVAGYRRDGVLVDPEVLDAQEVADLRRVIGEIVAGAAEVEANNDVYDLEPSHTRAMPRVRRIKAPTKVHPIFNDVLRRPKVLTILEALIAPALRMHGSKLNMKSAQYGSPVEWHQDWAFYPHTNDDILAIGVMLDDTDLENGAMLVSSGTHTGPVWNHHGEDGRFCGMIEPSEIRAEIARAVPCTGRAGSMSFHHVRAIHGSALNTSNRSRNLLLYEVAAADAWPLMGVKDFDEFNSRMIQGAPTIEPRVTPVPVRMPLPPALRQGSIYENQLSSDRTYFRRVA
jgi:ectoine hydroxylase-related dioxygenase (phytanoyl-CoA dioxygenase family)